MAKHNLVKKISRVSAEVAQELVGHKVRKISGKCFKSGQQINTVVAIEENPPPTGRTAFSFAEDSSIVDAHMCRAHVPRYLVFTGYSFDASNCQGGGRDFADAFSNYSEAVDKAKTLVRCAEAEEEGIWSHIFDTATLEVVAEYGEKN